MCYDFCYEEEIIVHIIDIPDFVVIIQVQSYKINANPFGTLILTIVDMVMVK